MYSRYAVSVASSSVPLCVIVCFQVYALLQVILSEHQLAQKVLVPLYHERPYFNSNCWPEKVFTCLSTNVSARRGLCGQGNIEIEASQKSELS